jgi:hypothetical protein
MKRAAVSVLAGCVVLGTVAAAGCARYPENRDTGPGKQILVTLRVRGRVQPPDALQPYYYFVLINRTDNLTDPGPVPVVSTPWGNGFAAPAQAGAQGFVGFVRFDRFQPQGYGVYRVAVINGQLDNPVNNRFEYLGPPDAFAPIDAGDATLSFRLDLARLPNPDARYLQFNLLATNNIPFASDDPFAPKLWDALGDGTTGEINVPVTIDTTQNTVRTNANSGQIEPERDVRERLDGPRVDEPNLDIVDWSVEIRSR